MKYDALINDIEGEAYNNTIRGNQLLKQINIVIEPAYHHELSKHFLIDLDTMSKKTMEEIYAINTESLENRRSDIREMLNMIVVQQRNFRRDVDISWKQAEELGVELMNDLKKQYHIE
jgi:hypothetical protein